jgi:hypothetical protein
MFGFGGGGGVGFGFGLGLGGGVGFGFRGVVGGSGALSVRAASGARVRGV